MDDLAKYARLVSPSFVCLEMDSGWWRGYPGLGAGNINKMRTLILPGNARPKQARKKDTALYCNVVLFYVL